MGDGAHLYSVYIVPYMNSILIAVYQDNGKFGGDKWSSL